MYSVEAIADLEREQAGIEAKYQALLLHYSQRHYRTARGREFATQGFLRRLGTLKRCIENVFQFLPPDLTGIPDTDALADTTIALQAFLVNVFGCLDNLTWIWVEEKGVRRSDGSALPHSCIGLGSKYLAVHQSFTPEFRNYLAERHDWFHHLGDYRNALAHRVPPYIPPCCVDPANQARFFELENIIFNDELAGNAQAEAQHRAEQDALKFFRPWMKHSFEEDSPVGVVHQQMLMDFLTIEEFAWRMRDQLDQLTPP